MNSGVYRIINIVNNKMYIGSSKDLNTRKTNHFIMLRGGKHHSIHLQRAFDKYGERNFKFEVLEYCEESIILDRENYYLNSYLKTKDYISNLNKEFLKLSYNILPHAVKGFGGTHRPETIAKLKLCSPNRKNILCYNQDGSLFKLFRSAKEAELQVGLDNGCILMLCKTKRYISKKFVFGFEEDRDFIKFIENS